MVASTALPGEQDPVHLDVPDAELIERQTRFLRAIDHRLGGGSCLDDALTLIYRIRHLPVRPAGAGQGRLDVAVADLHNLAAWASFDIGLTPRRTGISPGHWRWPGAAGTTGWSRTSSTGSA